MPYFKDTTLGTDDEAVVTTSDIGDMLKMMVISLVIGACICGVLGFVMLSCLGFKRQVYKLKKINMDTQSPRALRSPSSYMCASSFVPHSTASMPVQYQKDGVTINIGKQIKQQMRKHCENKLYS